MLSEEPHRLGRTRRGHHRLTAIGTDQSLRGALGSAQGLRHEGEADGAVRCGVERNGDLLVDALVDQSLRSSAKEGVKVASTLADVIFVHHDDLRAGLALS